MKRDGKAVFILSLVGIALFLAACGQAETPTWMAVHDSLLVESATDTPVPVLPPTELPTATPPAIHLPDLAAFGGANGRGGTTLWLMDENGQNLYAPFPELSNVSRLAWSPQGSWLGFTHEDCDHKGIRLYNPFELQERTVPNASVSDWSWSPDGNEIAYYASDPNNCQLVIYTPDYDTLRPLDSERYAGGCHAGHYIDTVAVYKWTNDGRYLFLNAGTSSHRGLIVIDVIDDKKIFSDTLIYTSAMISPDGKFLAVDLVEGSEGLELYDPSITIIDVQTSQRQKVVVGIYGEDTYQLLDWLPDGRILYRWIHAGNISYWYFNPQTDQQPVPADDYQPPADGIAAIQKRLPGAIQILWPAFSADGSRLGFSAKQDGQYSVYIYDQKTDTLIGPIAEGWGPEWQPVSRDAMAAAGYVTEVIWPTPAPTDTPEPAASLAWMKMMFWDTWFGYDPNVWGAGGHQYMPAITHLQIPQCVIREQGPTEYPYVSYEIDLGDIHYQVAEFLHSDTHADWYMAKRGPNGPFAGGLPSLVVNGTLTDWERCLADAQIVLATLTDIPPTSSASSNAGSASSSYFNCQGALSPRLWIGGYAYVSYEPPLSNRVRTGPGTNYSIVGMIAPGKAVKIIGGPECANGWVWWEIEVVGSRLVGWTAEGDSPDYWLIPCASATYCGR